MLLSRAEIFPADLLTVITESVETSLPGQWVGVQSPNGRLRFFGGGIHFRALRKGSRDYGPHYDYLASLWRQLPHIAEGTVDHRLIPVQAAAVALANGYLPRSHGVGNANTAFHEEFAEDDRAQMLAVRHGQPITSSAYAPLTRHRTIG